MANDVFANGREISCKAADGKSICAFPDVCFTPPQTPATPPGVPIPYPNTAFAKDTSSGSKKVKISNKEVMLKNKSFFKTSTGNEAGCAPKKGVITSKIKGKAYFNAWSMDVKVEGSNVVRHLDITTHNHGSPPNTGPWPHVDSSAFGKLDSCAKDREEMKKACPDGEPRCPGLLGTKKKTQLETMSVADAGAQGEKDADGSECVKKSRCYLRPYKARKSKGEDGCCPGQTGHHIPPKACFKRKDGKKYKKYSARRALVVCLEGMNQHAGSHGKNHAAIEFLAKKKKIKVGDRVSLADYNSMCAATVAAQCGCDKQCIEDQLNKSFEKKNIQEVEHVTTNSSGDPSAFKNKILKSAGMKVSKSK